MRNSLFHGRCYLCGEPAGGLHCQAHAWAAGEPTAPDETHHITLTELHGWWLERYKPGDIVHLAAGVS